MAEVFQQEIVQRFLIEHFAKKTITILADVNFHGRTINININQNSKVDVNTTPKSDGSWRLQIANPISTIHCHPDVGGIFFLTRPMGSMPHRYWPSTMRFWVDDMLAVFWYKTSRPLYIYQCDMVLSCSILLSKFDSLLSSLKFITKTKTIYLYNHKTTAVFHRSPPFVAGLGGEFELKLRRMKFLLQSLLIR